MAKVMEEVRIDPERYEVFVGKRQVELTPKQFDILVALYEADGRVLSREVLMAHVWGLKSAPGSDDIDVRTVDQHIARLRRRLGAPIIKTIATAGYKFMGPRRG